MGVAGFSLSIFFGMTNFSPYFIHGWDELKMLANVGGKDDPRAAIENMRAGSARRAKKTRDRQRALRSAQTKANITAVGTWDEVWKLANVGASSDPAGAIEDMRRKTAAKVKKHREKKRGLRNPSDTSAQASPQRKADFTVADEAANALDDKARLSLADRHVNRLGMVTIFSAVQNIAKTLS